MTPHNKGAELPDEPFGDGAAIMKVGNFYVSDDGQEYFCFAEDKPLFGCVAVGYQGVLGFHADGWSAETACFKLEPLSPQTRSDAGESQPAVTLTGDEVEKIKGALEQYVSVVRSVNNPNSFAPELADEGIHARTALSILAGKL
jgi:hypothetical protein